MLSHDQIWQAIDALAAHHGLTPSGLARLAGLDPTAFNPSKRMGRHGRPRWPSTESIAKILDATQTPLELFADLSARRKACVPVVCLSQAQPETAFTPHGLPKGPLWRQTPWRDLGLGLVPDRSHFGLLVDTNDLTPVYPAQTVLILSRTAPVTRGDRVLAFAPCLSAMPVVRILAAEGPALRMAPLSAPAPTGPCGPAASHQDQEIRWMTRIVWASQ